MRIVILVDSGEVTVLEPSGVEVYVFEANYIADHEGAAQQLREAWPENLHYLINQYDPEYKETK